MGNTYSNKDKGFVDLTGMTEEMREHSPGNKERKRRSTYANINTEQGRLEYLYFRNDVMCRQIIMR